MTGIASFVLSLKALRDTQGQDLIEYALMAGFVAVAAGAVMPNVANEYRYDLQPDQLGDGGGCFTELRLLWSRASDYQMGRIKRPAPTPEQLPVRVARLFPSTGVAAEYRRCMEYRSPVRWRPNLCTIIPTSRQTAEI